MHGYTGVPCRGVRRVVENSNLDKALDIVAMFAADLELASQLRQTPVHALALIPIPNGRCTLDADPPRTYAQARFIAQRLGGAEAIDVFRWRHVMPSANNGGGTRDPEALYEALVIRPGALNGWVPDRPCILIDDVLTTGGHVQASDAALEDLIGRRAGVALVAGVSDDEHVENPFVARTVVIGDFQPRRRRDDW